MSFKSIVNGWTDRRTMTEKTDHKSSSCNSVTGELEKRNATIPLDFQKNHK